MTQALRLTVPVLPGKRIEFSSLELPEEGDVELVIYLPQPDAASVSGASIHGSRYPQALEVEYDNLTSIQRARAMTADEQMRLQQIKAEINAIDASAEPVASGLRTLTAIADELASVRKALEQRTERS